mgnify:CR=1 FL=1
MGIVGLVLRRRRTRRHCPSCRLIHAEGLYPPGRRITDAYLDQHRPGTDFVAQYLFPVLYPGGLTRDAQIVIGFAVLLVNVVLYTIVHFKRARR